MTQVKGLFKAIKYYGSQKLLAKALGRSRQSVTNWINREEKIPDLQAILQIFSKLKGVIPLNELCENAGEIRQLLKSVMLFDLCPTTELNIKDIHIPNPCPIYHNFEQLVFDIPEEDRELPIIVDGNNQLITCECRVRSAALSKRNKIHVNRIPLADLIAEQISIDPLIAILPLSERTAVGLAVENELGNRQGRRMDLILRDEYPLVKAKIKTRAIAAKIAGFNSDFVYRQVKFILNNGIPKLIQALDKKIISVAKAHQIATFSKEEQYQKLN